MITSQCLVFTSNLKNSNRHQEAWHVGLEEITYWWGVSLPQQHKIQTVLHHCPFQTQMYSTLHSAISGAAQWTSFGNRINFKIHIWTCMRIYVYKYTSVFINKEIILTEIKKWVQVEVLLEEITQSISKHGSTTGNASTAQQTEQAQTSSRDWKYLTVVLMQLYLHILQPTLGAMLIQ